MRELKATTVNISFPKALLLAIDKVADEELRNRSELLREATRLYIERKTRWTGLFSFWRKEARSASFKPSHVERLIRQARKRRQSPAGTVPK